MDWYSRFKAEFFRAWRARRLPAPDGYEAQYTAALRRARFTPLPALPDPAPAPLATSLINAVYAFAALYARHCALLLGTTTRSVGRRADWCGRFNVGISLLDYLCDERSGLDRVRRLPSLGALDCGGRARQSMGTLTDTEQFLDDLARGLLRRVEREIGPPSGRGLWLSLRRMLAAELAVSAASLAPIGERSTVITALRFKSEEPFAVMAEWVARASARHSGTNRMARSLGRAFGRCYWMFDDARDLWGDFAARRWNYFLAHAVARDPRLASRDRDAILDVRLLHVLEGDHVARRAARDAVRRVVTVVSNLEGGERQRRALGLVAASLARL